MYKVCKSCGAQMVGNVCDKCGYGKKVESKELSKIKKQAAKMKHREAPIEDATENGELSRGKGATRLQFLIVLVIVVIVGIIFVLYKQGVFEKKGYQEVIGDYFLAVETLNYDDYLASMPKLIADEYREDYEKFDQNSELAYMQALYSDYIEAFTEDYAIEYTILNKEEWQKEDLDYLAEYFDEYHNTAVKVSSAYDVTTNITITGSNGVKEEGTVVVSVARVDKQWGVIGVS